MPELLSWVVSVIRDSEYKASDLFPGPGSNIRHPLAVFPSLHRVLAGPVPRLHRYYEGAATSYRPSHRTSFPSFGGTSVALVTFAPRRTSAPPRPGVGNPVSPAGNFRGDGGSPKFLGNPDCPFAHVLSDAGRTARTRPLQCSSVAPGMPTAKAPAIGLSTLNSMAFGLAVYASQCRLPRPHARLASSRWSDATGRAFHPQGSDERFQSCFLTSSPPLPSFA